MSDRIVLHGAAGSPYTSKMRAYLNYKEIPYRFSMAAPNFDRMKDIPKVIPVMVFPDKSYANDSTFMIQNLEQKFPERSVMPPDGAMRFLSLLVEDFADEWMTKVMYASRWQDPVDARFAGGYIAGTAMELDFGGFKMRGEMTRDKIARMIENIQVKRLKKVGVPDWELLAKTTREVLRIISECHGQNQTFFFGDRPSVAEFGLWGQMSQFLVDGSANRLMREFPVSYGWCHMFEDLSGYTIGGWDSEPRESLLRLLGVLGKTYIPFLHANYKAWQTKTGRFTVSLFDGEFTHSQAPFRYQVRCFEELRRQYASLSPLEAARVNRILQQTGCENVFKTSNAKL